MMLGGVLSFYQDVLRVKVGGTTLQSQMCKLFAGYNAGGLTEKERFGDDLATLRKSFWDRAIALKN